MPDEDPSLTDVESFLVDLHRAPVTDLTPLSGGFWSSAFAHRVAGRELVLRLGDSAEGFAMDRAAARFSSPELPVPDVLDIGETPHRHRDLGRHYAISVRHHGRFLEAVGPERSAQLGSTLVRLLDALRATPTGGLSTGGTAWTSADRGAPDWRSWLRRGLADEPDSHTHGWRRTVTAHADLGPLLARVERRIDELLAVVPERRDLVHGDLLHGNVLVTEDATAVTAVFSWKCAVLGDFLYDTAWCTFWSPWHPGVAAADVWHRMRSRGRWTGADWVDAPERHLCYELHIGAVHLGWYVWTADAENLARCATRLDEILERGPLGTALS